MNIDGINTGYVLDHIKAGKGFELYNLLGLDKVDCTVAIIQRASSAKYGAKDIIKIDADIPIDYDLIGYISPEQSSATLSNAAIRDASHLLKGVSRRDSSLWTKTAAATDAYTAIRCTDRNKKNTAAAFRLRQ